MVTSQQNCVVVTLDTGEEFIYKTINVIKNKNLSNLKFPT